MSRTRRVRFKMASGKENTPPAACFPHQGSSLQNSVGEEVFATCFRRNQVGQVWHPDHSQRMKPVIDLAYEGHSVRSQPPSSPAVGGKRNFPEKVGPRPLKRSKSGNTSASGPSNVAEKGQKSLKGFFKPKQDQPASKSNGNEKGASDLGS